MTRRSQLYLGLDMAKAERLELSGGEVVAFSASCPSTGRSNQDGALWMEIYERSGVLAVADGAGGLASGDLAASSALEQVAAALESAKPDGLREAVLRGFDAANCAVSALGVGAAATLSLLTVEGRTVRGYHAGDSLILVVGQRGRRKLESIAHSPVGYAVEAGVLDEAEALHHEERHVVSNLVGSPDMRIEISPPLELAPRDTLLLASDGVSDNLHLEELIELIRAGPLARVGRNLAAAVAERMHHPQDGMPSKPDDATFLLYRPRSRRSQGV